MLDYGVIFDMDGVLVDSYQAHYQSWRHTAAIYGLDLAEPDFAKTFGRTSRGIIHQLWPDRFSDSEIARFDTLKEKDYRDIIQKDFPEMSGAGDLLTRLHAAGLRLAIGSSGPAENIAAVQACLPNGQLFQATVNGSEVKHGKPDPEVFQIAARKLNLPPHRCAVIEDAPVGLQAARRAGAVPIALTGTAPRSVLTPLADLVVDSLADLTPEKIIALITQHKLH